MAEHRSISASPIVNGVGASGVRLAICVPTFNFGAFIGETLDSIIGQAPTDLEILVLDGGSTDDTQDVVAVRALRHRALRYIKQPYRGGIDRDMARVVELARAEYCWLFSADDIMVPDAIAYVLSKIASGDDVYLAGLTLASLQMQPIRDHKILSPEVPQRFELSDPSERLIYFNAAQTTTAFFSFMGSLIVRRARWLSIGMNEEFVGSCWAHVARLFELARSGLRVTYLARPLMLKRSDNDSFMDRGAVHRVAIAVDGFHKLGDRFFGHHSHEARNIRRVLRAEFGPYALLYVKLQAIESGSLELARLDALARKLYCDPGIADRVRLAIYQCLPVWAFRTLRSTLHALRTWRVRLRRP